MCKSCINPYDITSEFEIMCVILLEYTSHLCVNADIDEGQVEKVDFKVVWKKNTYDVSFPLDERVDKLKEHINTLCGELFNKHCL